MGKRLDRMRAKHASERLPNTVMTHPPGALPVYGSRQLTLGVSEPHEMDHVNWNQFGPKGTEHNWTDQSRKGPGPRPRPTTPTPDPRQGTLY